MPNWNCKSILLQEMWPCDKTRNSLFCKWIYLNWLIKNFKNRVYKHFKELIKKKVISSDWYFYKSKDILLNDDDGLRKDGAKAVSNCLLIVFKLNDIINIFQNYDKIF